MKPEIFIGKQRGCGLPGTAVKCWKCGNVWHLSSDAYESCPKCGKSTLSAKSPDAEMTAGLEIPVSCGINTPAGRQRIREHLSGATQDNVHYRYLVEALKMLDRQAEEIALYTKTNVDLLCERDKQAEQIEALKRECADWKRLAVKASRKGGE